MPPQTSTRRVYLSLFAGIFFISFSAIFVKWTAVPGLVSAFYRMSIATLALTLVQVIRRQSWPSMSLRALGFAALGGVFFAGDIAVWNIALAGASAANATLFGNTAPIWVAIGSWFLFGLRPGRAFWAGLALAMTGVLIILGGDVAAGPNLNHSNLLALIGGALYAAYQLTTYRARIDIDAVWYLWVVSFVGSIMLFGLNLLQATTLTGFDARTWLALAGLAIIVHTMGWLAINYAFGHLPPSIASATLLIQPALTALLAVPLLGEGIHPAQIAGGVCVLAGIYVVNRWGRSR